MGHEVGGDETGKGSFLMSCLGINGVEPSGSPPSLLVRRLRQTGHEARLN